MITLLLFKPPSPFLSCSSREGLVSAFRSLGPSFPPCSGPKVREFHSQRYGELLFVTVCQAKFMSPTTSVDLSFSGLFLPTGSTGGRRRPQVVGSMRVLPLLPVCSSPHVVLIVFFPAPSFPDLTLHLSPLPPIVCESPWFLPVGLQTLFVSFLE